MPDQLPDHLDDVIQFGMPAADLWALSPTGGLRPGVTNAQRTRGVVTAAIRQLVANGLLVPCSAEEFADQAAAGIPVVGTDG